MDSTQQQTQEQQQQQQQKEKEKPHSFVRRDRLREIEAQAQQLWAEKKFHEAQIKPGQKKFFATFPYPYMNGKLHLGHAFSLTKTEFATRYKKIQGYNVLFTQGFHCTGMPIQAAANRIKKELEQFGNPPVFPVEEQKKEEETQQQEQKKQQEEAQQQKQQEQEQKKNVKQKEEKKNDNKNQAAADKKAKEKKKVDQAPKKPEYQYNILKKMMIPENELNQFVDPVHWLNYFPPLGQSDLTKFGIHSDWRRTFITTNQNPYYNKFIEWQFLKLKQFGKIKFGKRPSIYSILDKQMCADHDRSEGLGINPQEYTLIKLQLVENFPQEVQAFTSKKIFLVAATLRPETMYGQTNCYILPEGMYGIFEMKNDEIFICSDRSALNMAAQEMTKTPFVVTKLGQIKGEKLIGQPLKAPLSQYEKVYTLPMKTISMTKGTGVVTSVPSDSPDDFANFKDYKTKKNLRDYYHIKDEWVLPFEPIPIIEVPGLSTMLAERACEEFKVQSGNDKVNLADAKEWAYKKGFYDGIMIIGEFKGQKVSEAKDKVKSQMIQNGLATLYYEPEKLVISRSGDECVVSFCDQWYINYADEQWKNLLKTHTTDTNKFQCYNEIAQKEINATIDWLKEWGCSRSFGQGTRLPWDQQFLIESLSDSTIYFAYYTIAHYLQSNLNGSKPGLFNINPDNLTEQVWDYVYLDGEYPADCKIPQEQLNKMREEFNYWYPMDLRCSGKDLIKNHLTMALFNHSAIWEKKPQLWPRNYFCNGYVQVDGEKMSKSLGNFYTVEDILNKYSTDAVRVSCANAGDGLDDANFTLETCDQAILRLTTLETWIKDVIKHQSTLRSADQKVDAKTEFLDQVFESQIKQKFCQIIDAYENMRFRDVLKYAFFEFQNLKDVYKLHVEKSGMRKDLVMKYIEDQLALMYPITPHFSEIIYHTDFYQQLLNEEQRKAYPEYLSQYILPQVTCGQLELMTLRKFELQEMLIYQGKVLIQKLQKNKNTKIKSANIIVSLNYHDWQVKVINLFKQSQFNEQNDIVSDWKKVIKDDYKVPGAELKIYYQFGQFILDDFKEHGQQAFDLSLPFSEIEVYTMIQDNIKSDFNVEDVQFITTDDAQKLNRKDFAQAIQQSRPGKPQIVFEITK